jgi:TolB-like protein/tetratricopeptide (TPR) repeat protein
MSLFPDFRRTKLIRAVFGVLILSATALFSTSLAAQTGPASEPAGSGEPFIAVLPLTNRSGTMEDARSVSTGIHYDLLSELSRVRGLKVVAYDSVMAFRNSAWNNRQLRQELGATHALEGEIHQVGERMLIRIQLTDLHTGEQLWADGFDRQITTSNIFGIQSAIVESVQGALLGAPGEEQEQTPTLVPTLNLDAYKAVLESRQLGRRRGDSAREKAIETARKAIRLDPSYANAQLALAQALIQSIEAGLLDEDQAEPEIRTSIEAAMTLAPGSDRAWAVRGRYLALTGDPGADEAFEVALQLNPGDAPTLQAFGRLLHGSGRSRRALPLLQRAVELNPLAPAPLYELGSVYDTLGEFGRAREVFARYQLIDPSSPRGLSATGSTYLATGQLEQSLYWLGAAFLNAPSDYELGGWMVFLNDCLEDFVTAGNWSRWLDARVTKQPLPMAMQARHHYLTGNFELALQTSNRALNLRLPDRAGSNAIFLRIKRDEALATGVPENGIAVFGQHLPGLLANPPDIAAGNAQQAVDLAQLLKLAGRSQDMQRLLNAVLEFYERPGSTGGSDRARLLIVKAEALAVMGKHDEALSELRRIVDDGWRVYWRWETVLNFNFNGVRETPEFLEIVGILTRDMTEQRERAQAMAARGEIPAAPDP